jgi:hypothetical protein
LPVFHAALPVSPAASGSRPAFPRISALGVQAVRLQPRAPDRTAAKRAILRRRAPAREKGLNALAPGRPEPCSRRRALGMSGGMDLRRFLNKRRWRKRKTEGPPSRAPEALPRRRRRCPPRIRPRNFGGRDKRVLSLAVSARGGLPPPGPRQVSSAQLSSTQLNSTQLNSAQLRPAQASSGQVRSGQRLRKAVAPPRPGERSWPQSA